MRTSHVSIGILVWLLFPAFFALGSTYYVAANGSDSNSGISKTAPWLHAPGMPNCSNTCAAYTPAAGDSIIFRGGDTWHFGNSSTSPYIGAGGWNWTWSGSSSSSRIYVGVDQTWFTGSSWIRPVMTADNPLSTSPVGSCPYVVAGGDQMIVLNGVAHVQFDNVEVTGFCWNSVPAFGDNVMLKYGGAAAGNGMDVLISNVYLHGWTHTNAGTQAGGTALQGYNQNYGVTIDHTVIDGSDSDDLSLEPFGQGGDTYIVQYSVIRHVGGTSVSNTCHVLHDTLFEYINNVTDGSSHTDVYFCYGEASNGQSDPNLFYNNVFRFIGTEYNQALSALILFSPPSGQTDYMFNTVAHDNQPGGSNYFNLNEAGGPGGGNLSVYNTTGVVGNAGCLICSSSGIGKVTSLNNHWVTTGTASSIFGDLNTLSESGAVYMTPTVAASQGYTAANDYAPMSAGVSTIGAGSNQANFCSGLTNTTAQSSCLSGTTNGCSYNSGNHSVSCPGITANARPASGAWNVGAYQFVGNQPAPPTNLTVTAQ